MKSYRFHPEVELDSDLAISWHLERSAELAFRLALEFQSGYRNIVENPNRFPTYLWGTRRLVLQEFPFSIIYREKTDEVEIIAVAHAKRRPGYWKRRV